MIKRNGLSILLALTLGLAALNAFANITVYSSPNMCQEIAGKWTGSGTTVIDIIGKPKCQYSGEMTVNGAYNFTLSGNLKKNSGSFACPKDLPTFSYQGTCKDNGQIVLYTKNTVDIKGDLTDQGHAAILNGKIYFSVLGKLITAYVQDLKIYKK